MKTYTTKRGTVITIENERVTAGKKSVHVSNFHALENSPDKAFWLAGFRRNNIDAAGIGLVAGESICIPLDGNAELIAAISAEAEAFRAATAAKHQAEDQAAAIERASILERIPAGCEIATHAGWLDGVVTYAAADGATISAWDDTYKPEGQGMFYIPSEKFADSRRTRAANKAANAQAKAEKDAHDSGAFAQARATGKRAVLRQWTTDRCMNKNDEECSFDTATEWAQPDGTKKTTYTCCF